MTAFSTAWMPAGSGSRFIANPTNLKTPEPINSRAEDYRSPGENSSPAGRTIPAGIGTSSYTGQPVWFNGFRKKDGKVTASFVMLFADCIFTDSFSLVKMFADEQLIISNVAPLRQSNQKIRFNDGSQTAVDPLLTGLLGEERATAWPGFVYAVFEDFDCSPYGNRVPLIRAVLSGAVTDIPATEERSSLTFGAIDNTSYSTNWLAVDRTKNHAYVFYWAGDDDGYISVVDISSNAEISRAFVQTSNYSLLEYMVALDGSDWLVATGFETSGTAYYDILLVNAYTGQVAARKEALLDSGQPLEARPHSAVPISATQYLVLCGTVSSGTASQSFLGALLVDIQAGTMEWVVHPYTNPAPGTGEPYSIAVGPVADGAVTIWYAEGVSGTFSVYKAIITASGFTSSLFYSEAASVSYFGVAYDATDEGVLVYHSTTFPSASTVMRKLDDDGNVLWTAANPVASLFINASYGTYADLRYSARPGFVVASQQDSTEDVYLIDLSDGTTTQIIEKSVFSNEGVFAYFDQLAGVYIEETAEAAGQINKITLGDSTPDTVDLADIFTQLATFDDRFSASDLDFTGFPGNETSGLKLENDTTTDNLEQSVADVYDVKIVESDGKRKYIYPPRDGSFAGADVTLQDADFVETEGQTIEKTIGAGEDEFAGCTVQYFDIDADYERLEQTYRRPIGIYDVTRSKKVRTISTVLSLSASQAMRLAAVNVYRSVLGNESFSFGLVPSKLHIEPADIVRFDFRGFTTVARIKEANLNANYTQDCLAYRYLQFSEATYTGLTVTQRVEGDLGPMSINVLLLQAPLLDYAHDKGGTGLVQYCSLSWYSAEQKTIRDITLYNGETPDTVYPVGSRYGISPVGGTADLNGVPADPFVTDFVNTITVYTYGGHLLESITADELYSGNMAALVNRETQHCLLIHFQTVTVPDPAYPHVLELSNIIWGARGTEVYLDEFAALVVPVEFELLKRDEYIKFINPIDWFDPDFYAPGSAKNAFLALGSSQPFHTLGYLSYKVLGIAETPYAATELAYSDAGSTRTITWEYRERLDPVKVLTGQESPGYSEASLAFEVDLLDGSDEVLTTLEVTTNSANYDTGTYTAASAIIYQMSALVGRGHAATLTF